MNYKKIVTAVLCICTVACFTLPFSSFASTAMQGSGTVDDPFLVASKQHLDEVRLQPDAHYRLTANITFTADDYAAGGDFYDHGIKPSDGFSSHYGLGFDPIGTPAEPFSGSFDGDGYSISGVFTSHDTSFRMYSGLFGYAENAVIENLHVLNLNIETYSNADQFSGAVLGYAENTTVRNCTASGIINSDNHAGGIVGYVDANSTISGCESAVSVTAIDSEYPASTPDILYAGGIAGTALGAIENCRNEGAVAATIEGGDQSHAYVGGIAGQIDGGTVTDSTNIGTVFSGIKEDAGAEERGSSVFSGGIAGLVVGGIISDGYNTGDISAVADSTAISGGIAGIDRWVNGGVDSTFTGCANSGAVEAQSLTYVVVGGIVADLSGNIVGSYNSGAVSGETNSPDRDIYSEIGGISGVSTGSISSSYNTGNITADGSAFEGYDHNMRTGGIVGRTFNCDGVADCYNTGNIMVAADDGNGVYTGGLIGMLENAGITNGYSVGSVTSPGRVSGGVGVMYSGSFANVYTNIGGNIIGQNTAGVDISYTWRLNTEDLLRSQASYVGFDFNSIWTMQGDTDYFYPELALFHVDSSASVSQVEIIIAPEKTLYALGEALDLTGGLVRVTYSDGTKVLQPMTAEMISDFSSTSIGTQTLTVTIGEGNAVFTVQVETKSNVVNTQIDQLLATLPQGDTLTEEQRNEVKNTVAIAVKQLADMGKESVRYDEQLLRKIDILEQALLKAEPLLSSVPIPPTIAEGVSAETAVPAVPVEVWGLVLSASGGGASGRPDLALSETEYSIAVEQQIPTDKQNGIVLNIYPTTWGGSVPNYSLYTPVTFKLYLNSTFASDTAYITHQIRESNEWPIDEELQVPVQSDEQGKFVILTFTKFSTFIISDAPPPPTAFITGTISCSSAYLNTTITLYAADDTEYENPIDVESESTEALSLYKQRISVEAEYGTYNLVIEKEGHLSHTIMGITLAEGGINLNSALEINEIPLYPGDVNDDDCINFLDIAIIRNTKNFGKNVVGNTENPPASNPLCDLDSSGIVDANDIRVILNGGGYNTTGGTVTGTLTMSNIYP